MSVEESPLLLQSRTVRSSDRAVSLWGLLLTAASTLALIEANPVSALFWAALLVFYPSSLSLTRRGLLIACAGATFALGSPLVLLSIPAGFVVVRMYSTAAKSLLVLASCGFLAHHLQSLGEHSGQTLSLLSMSFVLLPSIAATLVFSRSMGWQAVASTVSAAVVCVVLLDAAAGRWITFDLLGSDGFRSFVGVAPILGATLFPHERRNTEDQRAFLATIGAGSIGIAITAILPVSPVTSITFDESHGRWETVVGSFGPTDFGRAANYNYSLLAAYAGRLVGRTDIFESEKDKLPETSSIFVLKMPTKPLSEDFADRLGLWVTNGGRLLVVADHTDLFDTAQNLNALLGDRFGFKLDANAVFDRSGYPATPVVPRISALFGRIDATGRNFPWQTGTSVSTMPPNAVQLATYGLSFSEPGDYSRDNRFGPLLPRSSLPLADHAAIIGAAVGKGAVTLVLDSTPWSTFSIFKEQYPRLFRSIVYALERPAALWVWGWSALALGIFTFLAILSNLRVAFAIGGLTLGLVLGSAAQIGAAALQDDVEGRDFGLKVVMGKASKIEFLDQLVGPGERSFSRIVSAMAKYGLMPSAAEPGTNEFELDSATSWLLIQPDAEQLPSFERLKRLIESGGSLAIMFAPEQAADAEVRGWLGALGLGISKVSALSVAEDARPGGLLNRRGSAILRDVRSVSIASGTSLFRERETDQFFQSYTIRTVRFPRKSGILTLGFSADQFADDAVGSVWEGVHPSSIGRLRERQLSAVLKGEEFSHPFPDGLVVSSQTSGEDTKLNAFLLLEDGKVVLSGKFPEIKERSVRVRGPAPLDDPIGFLRELRDSAVSFIASSCPGKDRLTECENRMLSSDLLEWRVVWISNDFGQVQSIELVHERRYSSVGATLNAVFGR